MNGMANIMSGEEQHERERRASITAPIEKRILQMLNTRHRQSGIIAGKELRRLYKENWGDDLDSEALSSLLGFADRSLQDLLRGNLFPQLGVRGTEKKGGWFLFRLSGPAELLKVQDNILVLLQRIANPHPTSNEPVRHSLDAGCLQNFYGAQLKQRFDIRNFGCSSMRSFIERCDKLAVQMKGDKMHVMAKPAGLPTLPSKEDPAVPSTAPTALVHADAPLALEVEETEGETDRDTKKKKRKGREESTAEHAASPATEAAETEGAPGDAEEAAKRLAAKKKKKEKKKERLARM